MNMLAALIAALIALTVSVGFNLQQWRSCAVKAERVIGEQNTAVKAAEADAQKSARAEESASVAASNDVGQVYEEDKRDVQAKADQFAADLRPDSVELREPWKGCPAASRVPEAGATASQPDAADASRRESLKRIAEDMGRARAAVGEAKAQIDGLQLYIRTVCQTAPQPAATGKPTQVRK